MSEIAVEVVPGAVDIGPAWNDLAERAEVNVFQHPAGTNAVSATGYGQTYTLLARRHGRLVGLWTFEETKMGPFRFLNGLPHRYAFIAGPVIDRDHTDAVVSAFFAAFASDPSLPKVLHARFLDGGQTAWHALASVPGTRRRAILFQRQRAFLTRDAGAKRSGSTRKKMRQDWNRLAAQGEIAIVNDRDPSAARRAFETFLAIEAKSWKGEEGTAILSRPDDARFIRRWFADLAEAGAASVALLTLDGKPIAAQVLLSAGNTAYTWKIGYDAAWEKFSPGVLLIDKLSEQLLEAGIEQIESCSPQGGFMEKVWSGRRWTGEILFEFGDRPTLSYPAVMLAARGYETLRAVYHRAKAWRSPARAPKIAPAN
ncbi:MAG TPA: GNAT family N-acetyltransferase [Bauldia sp.]|nr:GNAT family N-acetyltransferase [Bauldia sp.]